MLGKNSRTDYAYNTYVQLAQIVNLEVSLWRIVADATSTSHFG